MPREKRLVRRAKKNKPIRQVAAVPYRPTTDGGIEVLLVTSNTTRRFIVPKGWPMKSKTGREAAAQEAFEEAGVRGEPSEKPFGAYAYWKRLSGSFVKVNVKVFMLAVDEVLADWEEQGKRARAWLSPADAATLIDEPELAALVLSLVDHPPAKEPRKARPAAKAARPRRGKAVAPES
ncbi:MAG: NUDIX hydrolase [Mesorhizobium sp.]|nr:NUDIX hydrolase [Mesorhizobium sp.]MBL8578347.1 NUDIX hydrolase [Mesorhizobium sp.]